MVAGVLTPELLMLVSFSATNNLGTAYAIYLALMNTAIQANVLRIAPNIISNLYEKHRGAKIICILNTRS